MNIVLSNISAICKTDRQLWNGIPYSAAICGTEDGSILIYDYKTSSVKKLYQFSSRLPILQITIDRQILGVIVQGDGSYDENDIPIYSYVYHIEIKNLSKGAILIGTNADILLNPYVMFMYDMLFLGVYVPKENKIKIARKFDYFQGDILFDISNLCLAINKHMVTASVYTLDLSDFSTWGKDTFSCDGDLIKDVAQFLEEKTYCSYGEIGSYEVNENEIVEQEEVFNSRLPQKLVRSLHNKYTYLDFVKLYENIPYKDNPYIVTGGRDCRIIISNFNNNKVFFDKQFETIPRCCCHNVNYVFVGCDEGLIVKINKSNYVYSTFAFGEERFRFIDIFCKESIVAVNTDNVVFCIDINLMEVIKIAEINEGVSKVIATEKGAYIVSETGKLITLEY